MKIEDYGIIGDTQTAALVGRNGSIDWLCLPHFNSPACFAALLGTPEHGRWLLGPKGEARSTRSYVDHSFVLETVHETATGAVKYTIPCFSLGLETDAPYADVVTYACNFMVSTGATVTIGAF